MVNKYTIGHILERENFAPEKIRPQGGRSQESRQGFAGGLGRPLWLRAILHESNREGQGKPLTGRDRDDRGRVEGFN